MKVNLNIQEIFDSNSEFELQMFQVFTAKNDLNMINLLLQKAEPSREYAFLFKIMLGILREAIMLIKEITENRNVEISKFNNHNKIQETLDRFHKLNHGMDEKSFSYQVLRNVRNQIFHYRKTENIREIIDDLKEPTLSFEWGNTIGKIDYTFTNELLYEYVNDEYITYSGNKSMTEFIQEIAPYSICTAELLDDLIIGFLDKHTDLMVGTFDGKNIKRIAY